MRKIGYSHLQERFFPNARMPLKHWAEVRPVTRVSLIGKCLATPSAVAPSDDRALSHVLFALKHEGINLLILSQALPSISPVELCTELARSPNGIYIRKACFLWESFTGRQLEHSEQVGGATQPLFDPKRYVTGPTVRDARWRIDFNGLGSLRYCATVERTQEIEALLQLDTLGRAADFTASLSPEMLDRATTWAYLHETQSSFAIERETPSEDRARRFIQVLHQAHDQRELDEDYLVELQNCVVANPILKAAAFRHEQNYLQSGLRGSAGVTYVPPPPDLCRELMIELIQFANSTPGQIPPLVAAGITAFGMVFLHPFMDGNGRLSRFLIHQSLCRSGALSNGLILPVSVAMKQDEREYLETLRDFSRPTRDFWEVNWLDAESMDFHFSGSPALYRYWDATPSVAFTIKMAERALETELRRETEFLERYDHLVRLTDERFDIRGSDLAKLAIMCLDNGGVLSRNRRKQFQYSVPPEAFDFMEEQARQMLSPPSEDHEVEFNPSPEH